MDKKKKSKSTKPKSKPKRKRLSPLMQLVLNVGLFCISFMILIGFTYLPGVRKNLDFSVRNRMAKVLTWAYPNYEIGTIAANRKVEEDNMLTIGYLQKEEIQRIALQQQAGASEYLNLKFHNVQLRIRELIITPMLLLGLLFVFTPIPLKYKVPGGFLGLLILYGLILLKVIAIVGFSITSTYEPDNLSTLQKTIPYFSSPGLVFLIVLIIWMALVFPFINRKAFEQYFKTF